MSKYQEIKPIKKLLPYSIKDIGGKDELRAWKIQQAIEWTNFNSRRLEKFEAIKELPMGELSDFYKNTSESGKRIAAMWKRLNDSPAPLFGHAPIQKSSFEKESFLKRLTNRALDWFLSLNYELER